VWHHICARPSGWPGNILRRIGLAFLAIFLFRTAFIPSSAEVVFQDYKLHATMEPAE
jgi:hypothetical protein